MAPQIAVTHKPHYHTHYQRDILGNGRPQRNARHPYVHHRDKKKTRPYVKHITPYRHPHGYACVLHAYKPPLENIEGKCHRRRPHPHSEIVMSRPSGLSAVKNIESHPHQRTLQHNYRQAQE